MNLIKPEYCSVFSGELLQEVLPIVELHVVPD